MNVYVRKYVLACSHITIARDCLRVSHLFMSTLDFNHLFLFLYRKYKNNLPH